ncbi:hypothetical protein UY456_07265 [Paenibacillus polymyxa]|uniref:hypothetical protein n=1 Tax=Paenibacillus polymyxa TaxID=1406 RepID=UPI002AB337CA|nr:hypothetical protein [Paenibacillus polymyxa]MDY8092788.1 hypothetical protein [Paenibacillus polymyxa]
MNQKEFDDTVHKLLNDYSNINLEEYREIVEFIQARYNGYDPIISSLSSREILQSFDFFARSYAESVKDKKVWGSGSKHYILNNLYKSSYGLTSENRRKIFAEKNLTLYQDNVGFGRRTGFVRFLFFVDQDVPYLLIAKEYGYNSITNKIEEVVDTIETEYLKDVGFSVIENEVMIWYMEDSEFYQQVQLKPGLVNPEWRNLGLKEKLWFENAWLTRRRESKRDQKDTFFFEKGRQFDAYNIIKAILMGAKREILIIDNYIDTSLFLVLGEVDQSVAIKILTSKLHGDTPIAIEKYKAQRGNFEWCQVKDFHDRYIFIDNECYLLGASIKDFANRATTLSAIKDKQVVIIIKNYAMDKFNEALAKKSIVDANLYK